MTFRSVGMLRTLHTGSRSLSTSIPRANAAVIRAIPQRFSLSPSNALRLSPPQQQSLPSTPLRSRLLRTSAPRLAQPPTTVQAPSSFKYAIAAAYSAKHHRFHQSNIFSHDPYVRQKPGRREKKARPKSGEDSFFVSPINSTGNIAFGVVDGVGGWQSSGVDPADFAHGLCEFMTSAATAWPEWEELAETGGSSTGNKSTNGGTKASTAVDHEALEPLRPVELLQEGYDRVLGDRSIFAGGSTACVAIAAPSGRVEVANLGDSGLLHLSPHRITTLTTPQTHAFNTPFQLSKLPPRLLVQQAIFGGGKPYSELPTNSDVSAHQLTPGDVLVLATDGVWDNLSAQEILGIVSTEMDEAEAWGVGDDGGSGVSHLLSDMTGQVDGSNSDSLQTRLAVAVTKAAKEASLSRTKDGPFAKEVQRRYPQENWKGGKADDICVVVAIAVAVNGA